jgi:hypothetical protein
MIANASKILIFATFFTFPPLDWLNCSNLLDSPFLSYFPLLSMELQVTGRTPDKETIGFRERRRTERSKKRLRFAGRST